MRLENGKRSVVVVAGLISAAVVAAAGCTDGDDCNVECPIARFIEVHVQSTAEVLEQATMNICTNAQCAEQPVLETPDASAAPSFVSATDLPDGWFTLTLGKDLQTGDVVHVTVTNAAGASLLDETRTTKLFGDNDDACSCGPFGDFPFYSGAISGLTCTGTSLASGIALNGTFAVTSTASHTLTVCRNALCSTQTLPSRSEPNKVYASLTSPLDGSVVVSTDGRTLGAFAAHVGAQPEDLADGDIYRVTIDDGTLYNRTVTATYRRESYPDGKDCDTMPARNATLSL